MSRQVGTEHYSAGVLANMVVVTVGVAIASYGEINFVLIGFLMQLAAILIEACRLIMVQARRISGLVSVGTSGAGGCPHSHACLHARAFASKSISPK